MYDTILHIAHDIIVIGGALLMVLGVILLCMLIAIAARVNSVVSKSMETVSMVSQYIMLPFTYIASFLNRKPEADADESEMPKRKASTRRK